MMAEQSEGFEMEVIAERIQEDPEISEWFSRLEAEADRDVEERRKRRARREGRA